MDAQRTGKTIAYLRKRAGLTQRELAARLKVTDKAVSRWERGLGMPDQSLLAALADVLHTDVEAILGGEYTHGEPDWAGVLLLRYGEGLGPGTELYSRSCVCLQLGYLLLAGVREVAVAGERPLLAEARRMLLSATELGVELSYVDISAGRGAPSRRPGPVVPEGGQRCRGTMLVGGLDFLYGKDLTRAFKRQMAECAAPVRLASHGGGPTSVCFVPGERDPLELARGFDLGRARIQPLERGTVAFPIANRADALDAANLLAILERHGEPVMDLGMIARSRGLGPGPGGTE